MNKILPAIVLIVALALAMAGCQPGEPEKPVGATAPPAAQGFAKKPGGTEAQAQSAQMQQGVSEQEAAARIGSSNPK